MQRFVNEVEFHDVLNITTENIMVHLVMSNVFKPPQGSVYTPGEGPSVMFHGIAPKRFGQNCSKNIVQDTESLPRMVVSQQVLDVAVPNSHNQSIVRLHFIAHSNAKFYK